MSFLQQSINILADLLNLMIIIRVLMSWFVPHPERHRLGNFMVECTDPILKPIRRALPRLGMIDLSPLVALILIGLIRDLINTLL